MIIIIMADFILQAQEIWHSQMWQDNQVWSLPQPGIGKQNTHKNICITNVIYAQATY